MQLGSNQLGLSQVQRVPAPTGWKHFSLERQQMPESGEAAGLIEGYQIWLILKGSTQMTWRIGEQDQSHTIFPRDLCTATHGDFRSVSWAGAFETLWFWISPKVMADLNQQAEGDGTIELKTKYGWRDPKIETMLHLLQGDITDGHHRGPVFGEQLCMALAAYLFEGYCVVRPGKLEYPSRLPGSVLRRALAYIDERISGPITVEEMASELNLSRFYFARLFRNSVGQSPGQYILDRRLERAKRLLETKKLSLSEVANTCGFSSQSHFSATFYLRTGCPPSRYRQMHGSS
jgi:AraC family transcriptional regulator